MDLTSETVHFLGGVAFVLTSLLLILQSVRGRSEGWTQFLLPALFIVYGIESFFDLGIHGDAVPENYAAEPAQHLTQGSIILAAGLLEILRLSGVLENVLWKLVVPLGLVGLGAVFLIHAQHGMDPGAMMVMTLQHRAFGVVLVLAAAARAVADFRPEDRGRDDLGWAWLLLAFGVLLMAYQEGGGAMG